MSETATSRTKKYTIGVDFDGVLHSYVSGWKGAMEFPDPPVPGAIEWLREMSKDFGIHICSARARTVGAPAAMRAYLREAGLESDVLDEVSISAVKEPCLIYIDDRGYRFTGDNFPSANTIHLARPWMKGLTVEQVLEGPTPIPYAGDSP